MNRAVLPDYGMFEADSSKGGRRGNHRSGGGSNRDRTLVPILGFIDAAHPQAERLADKAARAAARAAVAGT